MQAAIGKIVIGVDGSDASLDAIRWALQYAELTNYDVEVVASWRYPAHYGYEFYGEKEDWESIARTTLDSAINQVVALQKGKGKGSIKVTRTVSQGHPAEVLTDASLGADLLVVGCRGHGGFVGMLLGSVSQRVTAHAHCPVVVVRHHNPTHKTARSPRCSGVAGLRPELIVSSVPGESALASLVDRLRSWLWASESRMHDLQHYCCSFDAGIMAHEFARVLSSWAPHPAGRPQSFPA